MSWLRNIEWAKYDSLIRTILAMVIILFLLVWAWFGPHDIEWTLDFITNMFRPYEGPWPMPYLP